ncbi:HAMP domain-containing sensor histidine kinase [Thalassotalea sediminis]|uniref:HAMP domain-containing sensor histidine kinase n=1 Tax=Thalassotalea sediminis TaxID=1759089 RepID=UPI0025744487|nr:HAMP domain-containing sensor histidine kinase [Thalassotalea sediminis]
MSIQRYLLLIILSVITLVTFGAAIHGYRASKAELENIFDQELRIVAHSIANLQSSESVIDQDEQSTLTYQVWQANKLLYRSSNAPAFRLLDDQHGFGYQNFSGARWRIYSEEINNRFVIVAQQHLQRVDAAERVLLTAILPVVLIIPLIGFFVVIAIQRSLKPLRELSESVKAKSSEDLSPVFLTRESIELQPIVFRLNSLLAKLGSAFEKEKRLAADAAHELRTPVSVLTINAHNIQTSFERGELTKDMLVALNQSVERMAHVVEQILTLYRTSPDSFSAQFEPLNIDLVLQRTIASLYEKVAEHKQQISLESSNLTVLGDEFTLLTLFSNLVGNAIKYAGENAEIFVEAKPYNNQVLVAVHDNGPGIPQEKRQKIFDRFYRLEGAKQNMSVTGSGLGMSIVKHIVELHHGNIELLDSSLGGLEVRIILPCVTLPAKGVSN